MANDAANKGYVDTYKKVYYVDKNKRSNNPSWIGLSFNREGNVELVLNKDFYQHVSGFLYFVTNNNFNMLSIGHVEGQGTGERWIEFPASQFLVQNWEEQAEMTYLIFISD